MNGGLCDEFKKLYNKAKKFSHVTATACVRIQTLECSELDMKDRQLVLTGVDYKKVDDLFKQLSTSLKMFFGQQAASGHEMDSTSSIKVESACITTDVNYSRNPFWRNTGHRTECEIQSDVVTSDITLLLSKDSMKKAKVKLDLENDCASIFGKEVQLQSTSSGHNCVPINQINVSVEDTKSALVPSKPTETTAIIRKVHKQFAYPSAKRLKSLLKDAGGYSEEHMVCVDRVTENCELCKQYKKTPARPVVSLPLATDFNEVVATDLKEWKSNVYFLHLVYVATRFSLAAVVRSHQR